VRTHRARLLLCNTRSQPTLPSKYPTRPRHRHSQALADPAPLHLPLTPTPMFAAAQTRISPQPGPAEAVEEVEAVSAAARAITTAATCASPHLHHNRADINNTSTLARMAPAQIRTTQDRWADRADQDRVKALLVPVLLQLWATSAYRSPDSARTMS